MGAVLKIFNSVLNSAATIFSMDIYMAFYKNASERQLVKVGKYLSALLAIFAIFVAPMVANAPGTLPALQQLNGIHFIPVASILIAGFFIKQISALGAKVSLIVGLSFIY